MLPCLGARPSDTKDWEAGPCSRTNCCMCGASVVVDGEVLFDAKVLMCMIAHACSLPSHGRRHTPAKL